MIKWMGLVLLVAISAAAFSVGGLGNAIASGAAYLTLLMVVGVALVLAVGVTMFRGVSY